MPDTAVENTHFDGDSEHSHNYQLEDHIDRHIQGGPTGLCRRSDLCLRFLCLLVLLCT